jgi:hypothetical protein
MRTFATFVVAVVPVLLITATSGQSQKRSALSPQILSAKSVYFDNQTGAALVGERALAELKKWGHFQITDQHEREKADLVILLSADPYRGGYVLLADGKTGTVGGKGSIEADPVPNYNKAAPVRYAHLTVIEPASGKELWSSSRPWGGLLTGFNSAGERLIKSLEKQIRK